MLSWFLQVCNFEMRIERFEGLKDAALHYPRKEALHAYRQWFHSIDAFLKTWSLSLSLILKDQLKHHHAIFGANSRTFWRTFYTTQ